MAEIFLAFTAGPGGFRKFVTLKRILPENREDEGFVEMFLEEARLTAAMSHASIAQVFELNEDKGDKPGPIPMAAAVAAPSAEAPKPDAAPDAPKPETRVAVFGDSDFVTNGVLGIQGNKDIFMNTLGWLTQQENLISIRPKEADDRRLTLTATQQNNITWLSLLIVPGLVFGSGIYSWYRRR